MNATMKLGCGLLVFGAVACVEPQDKPDLVHDFRVLGISTERPELMAPVCELNQDALNALREEVTYRALMVDPKGGNRPIRYSLWACADASDTLCSDAANHVELASGTASEGVLQLSIHPGEALAGDGTPLLYRVQEKDPYKGLGGLRMPLVLHAQAGDEEIYAQKLMVFSCPLVEGMTPNNNPVLPGLNLEDSTWPEEISKDLHGPGPFAISVDDVSSLEEHYVVPGIRVKSVSLTESWKISWYTTLGKFSAEETGGADFGGEVGRHRTKWEPPKEGGAEQDVTFWAVVRDGRGGVSWTIRRAHWVP
jgi:hypothetical protein